MRRRYERRRAAKAAAASAVSTGASNGGGAPETAALAPDATANAAGVGLSTQSSVVGGTKRQQTVHAAAQIKLHVHGHEFMNGEDIVLNPESFPQLREMVLKDYVVEVFHPATASPALSPLLSPSERAERLSEGSPCQHLLLEIPESSAGPIKGKLQVSVLKETAALFQLAAFKDVTVRFLPKTQVEVDFVEISLKDHFMSRRDLWYFQKALVGSALHVGRSIRLQSARWQVMDIRSSGERVRSGVVSEHTKFTFRSRTSRVMWLVQISPEMWDIANSGNLYLEILLQFVKNVLEKWIKHKVSHSLTILFYSRSYYPEMDQDLDRSVAGRFTQSRGSAGPRRKQAGRQGGDETGSTFPYDRSDCFSIGVDEQGRHYQDFYKIVTLDSSISDVQPLLVKMKQEINAFPHECGWRSPADLYMSSFSPAEPQPSGDSTDPQTRHGVPSNARDGNMLEAVNLVLNIFEKHHIDRHLSRSGQSVVLITAGNGIFSVNKRLSEITEQRMMDHGIGIDMISLASRPLHKCPLFLFKESDLTDMKLPPRTNGDPGSGAADICLCNPVANYSTNHVGSKGQRRSRTGSQDGNGDASQSFMGGGELGVSSATRANHLCKYCTQRQESRKKYVVPLWIPICFVQEQMLVPHQCSLDEAITQFCAICHPRVTKSKEFEPLPMCRMFKDDDFTHFSHLSLPKPLECLLNDFQSPDGSLSDDERDNVTSATMMSGVSTTFDDFTLSGLDSDLVRARASSLLSSEDSLSYNGSVVTKVHSFSSISGNQLVQEFEQYDDQVFGFAMVRPRGLTKLSESDITSTRLAMTPPLRPANPLMGSVFKKRGPMLGGVQSGSAGNNNNNANENGSNNSGGGRWRQLEQRNMSPLNVDQRYPGYADVQTGSSDETRHLPGSLPNTFQLEGGIGGSSAAHATYASSPVVKPTENGTVKDDIFHSQEYIMKQLTSNQRRWSQVRPYQDYRYKLAQNALKWRSLCFPALLPLTSDFIPGAKELKAHYTESFYSVMLPERDEGNGVVFRDYRELVMEMVAQRFSQDFQLVTVEDSEGVADLNGTVFRLSMGHRIHEIVYNEETQTIDVKRYLQKVTSRSDVDIMEYRYSLWSPVTDGFVSVTQEFRKYPQIEYQWNHLDQLICGYIDDMSEGIRYKRLLFCSIPPQLDGDEATCRETLQTYTERCRKFLEYLRSKADISTGFPDVKLSTEWRDDLETSGPGAFKRVGHRSVKVMMHSTDTFTSQNWLILKVDTELLATQCYHIEVQWLACMGLLVDDVITSTLRRAKQVGLDVVQVPENGISSNLDLHPIVAPVFLPLSDPHEQSLVERALVERFGFYCEALHPIPFTHLNHDKEYATAAPEPRPVRGRRVVAYYRQYAHRSLPCFARMTQTGLIWISNQQAHDHEIQPIFDKLERYMQSVHVAHAEVSAIIDSMVGSIDSTPREEESATPQPSDSAVLATTDDESPGHLTTDDATDAQETAVSSASTCSDGDDKENEVRALNANLPSPKEAEDKRPAAAAASTATTVGKELNSADDSDDGDGMPYHAGPLAADGPVVTDTSLSLDTNGGELEHLW